ncbi:Fur family transcriptional regulator [Jannaschia pohangensis]|uniref:Fur family transcriptional regulator, zinc uptake regulator n=1 Tax=Jannaschia pohangensis TaxID=390807 RepID=A0A1I3IWF7_9RHOB|nr:Fur family transcriptional regulator [Jannaschia pohangensis]SFI52153.1 Fur family transcriptional regulator, zinc uptake regulator [Jannaschia pohangensis]
MTSESSSSNDLEGATTPVGFAHHDHDTCVAEGLAAAETRCEEDSLRFTPVRRKVLEILLQEHRALGAYSILDRLREEGFGSQPPVAYRALEFLVAHGLVHKIERLNAFIACAHPGEKHAPAFMICRMCECVAEAQSAPARGALGAAARATGFRIERTVVEAEGVCPTCADKVTKEVPA